MMNMFSHARYTFFLVLFSTFALSALNAQDRINDKDLESLMRNLRDDAKSFHSPFASALKKSSIRKTSRAKDADNLSVLFASQCETLLNNFKRTRKGDSNLSAVQNSAQQIGAVVSSNELGDQVNNRWNKIQSELGQILSAYGVTPTDAANDNPRGITAADGSGAGACFQAVGSERSARLVQECLQVSPATHPPCNAQNSCSLIIDEIKRGCGLLDARDRPAFCGEYK